MKRFLILLFSLFSIFTYGANSVNEAEVNKYIREKLDRDKTITFTTKLNKANNTLEGYSDEGVLCAITPLDKQPDMISLLQIKSIISEKNGKLKPVYEIRNNNNQLLVRSEYDLNKPINIFKTELFLAYFHGQVPFNSEVENLIKSINSIKSEINYLDTNTKGIPKLKLLSTKAPSDGKNFCCLLINICSEISPEPKNKIQKPTIPIITRSQEPNL